MSIVEKHIVPKGIKKYLNQYVPEIFTYISSKTKAKKAIAKGELLVNGKKVNEDYFVKPHDILELRSKSGEKSSHNPHRKTYDQDIEVIFEDEHIAAVNKPSGIPVNGFQAKTLEHALPKNLSPSPENDALDFPAPVHRLDEPTSGIVIIAKTHRAQVELGKTFQNKTIQKRYKAICIGGLKGNGDIKTDVDKKNAHTKYEVIKTHKSKTYGSITFVNLYPITGRTHQLRVHLSSIGHPIIGDKYYAQTFKVFTTKGLFLCSDQVIFNHPVSGKKLELSIPLPRKFDRYLEREQFAANKTNQSSPKPQNQRKKKF